ncbi:MAG TPA: polysaccharide deacetylase family protein [Thermoanaerobaculia bacterium]|nr:polysaccharide deacetylase family protein [Thermoanaerobaculia bacterium]
MNPALKALGFAPGDRVMVLHADDVGMCEPTLLAFAELAAAGTVTAGSVMVPCPGFAATAAYCREHLEVDAGVHLTLTSEWPAYRWGPISTGDPDSGLLDGEGYFHHDRAEVWERARPEAVTVELREQIRRARQFGIDPTHADGHMLAVFHPRLLASYVEIVLEEGLLPLLWWPRPGSRSPSGPESLELFEAWAERGVPVFDHLALIPLSRTGDRLEHARELVDNLPAGLTWWLVHPAVDTPDLRRTIPDWRARVAELEALRSPELLRQLRRRGIHCIGCRVLREVSGRAG